MCGPVLRRLASVIAMTALVLVALLAPEHVHAAGHGDEPHGQIVHRHLAPHHSQLPVPSADDDDGPAFWVDTPMRITPRIAVGATLAILRGSSEPVATVSAVAARAVPFSPPDLPDPPLAAARDFRGPPSSL